VVVPPETANAKEARLKYQTLQPVPGGWLVEVSLETGRKHQIRVQLATRGWPILGDKKYGSTQSWSQGIALHARRLELIHPVREMGLCLVASLPPAWEATGLRG
jgi:23S rRNA pseudouridine1911/1915/1917 synthase